MYGAAAESGMRLARFPLCPSAVDRAAASHCPASSFSFSRAALQMAYNRRPCACVLSETTGQLPPRRCSLELRKDFGVEAQEEGRQKEADRHKRREEWDGGPHVWT